ncbi:MAG: hypothetical protein U9R38_02285 [Candidatus Margulisiibacteriota bacterium]|nr:hypothetical protein [Candidatus Margulisiibacteriota bacterium]
MFKKIRIGLFLVVCLILIGGIAFAVPTLMNYQGKLTDASNVPKDDGNYSFVFKLYSVASGGTYFWTETQTVSTESGFFNVLLGSVTPLSATDFTREAIYLGINVDADGEMTPRQRVVPSGYAFNSDLLDGHDSSYFAPATGGDYVLKAGDEMTGTLTVGASALAISAEATDNGGTAVYGAASKYDGGGIGGYFYSHGETGKGIYAKSDGGDESYAGYFDHSGTTGGGIKAITNSPNSARAVWGWATSGSGTTYGGYFRSNSPSGYGLYSQNTAGGWAGYFNGPVNVVGTLTATSSIYTDAFYGDGQYLSNVATEGSYVKLAPTSEQTVSASKAIWIQNTQGGASGIKVTMSGEDETLAGNFVSQSGSGWGVWAQGGKYGMEARAGTGTAVRGLATDESAATYGGEFITRSSAGKGLVATSEGGSYSGNGYYAELATPSWAGYFNGPVNVSGSMTATTFHGDGSNLTGVATSGDLGDYVLKTGDEMDGALTVEVGSSKAYLGRTGPGVRGEGASIGIQAYTEGSGGIGLQSEVTGEGTAHAVDGQATNTGDFENYGGYFQVEGQRGRGVYGFANNNVGANYGGYFRADGSSGVGVYGVGDSIGSAANVGGYFVAKGNSAGAKGISAEAAGAAANFGGFFVTKSSLGTGLYATSEGSTLAASLATPDWAGYFEGPVNVVGSMTASSYYYDDGTSLEGKYVEFEPVSKQTASGNNAIWVQAAGSPGYVVSAEASADGTAVFGRSVNGEKGTLGDGANNAGVRGEGTVYGVYGRSNNASSYGVYGESGAVSSHGLYGSAGGDSSYGVYGVSTGGAISIGVYGAATDTTSSTNYGGRFSAAGINGYAVYGNASNASGNTNHGGHFTSAGTQGAGVYGSSSHNYGGQFIGGGLSGIGLYAKANGTTGFNYGGYIVTRSWQGTGLLVTNEGTGIHHYAKFADPNWAGYFNGPVNITGTLSAGDISGFVKDTGDTMTGVLTTGAQIISTVETGTAPFQISSTTVVANLNADMVDGKHASEFLTQEAADDLYVLKAGDTMIGTLTVETSDLYAIRIKTTNGSGYGISAESTGSFGGVGVYGMGDNTGVKGLATATSKSTFGGYFTSVAGSGYGVVGEHLGSSGGGMGGYFQSNADDGTGVCGFAISTEGTNYGGRFRTSSTDGMGLLASSEAAGGNGYYAQLARNDYAGYFEGPVNITGTLEAPELSGYVKLGPGGAQTGGIHAINVEGTDYGIEAKATYIGSKATYGGKFTSSSDNGYGIYAANDSGAGSGGGGYFETYSPSGYGVYSYSGSNEGTNYAGYFYSTSDDSIGLYATSEGSGMGASLATPTYAGYFEGPVNVVGSMTATAGFYGDGSNLTGVATSGDLGDYVLKTGDTMTGVLTVDTSSVYSIRALNSSTEGRAVYGIASNANLGTKYGGYFQANGQNGHAVYANATGTNGLGVWGNSTHIGLYGVGPTAGVKGNSSSSDGAGLIGASSGAGGRGVVGQATNSGAVEHYGGEFYAMGTLGYGVHVTAYSTTGATHGGYFVVKSSDGIGLGVTNEASGGDGYYAQLGTGNWAGYFEGPVNVSGSMTATTLYGDGSNLTGVPTGGAGGDYVELGPSAMQTEATQPYAIWVKATNSTGAAISAESPASGSTNYGGFFRSNGGSSVAVHGEGVNSYRYGQLGGLNAGVYGSAGLGSGIAVKGHATTGEGTAIGGYFSSHADAGRGVYGYSNGDSGVGGYFAVGYGDGVGLVATTETHDNYAQLATPNWAGYFNGPVNVSGSMTATTLYGDGSNLTGVATSGDLGAYVLKAGDTMTGTLTLSVDSARGVSAITSNSGGYGVYGYATAESGTNYGGYFGTDSTAGYGLYALNRMQSPVSEAYLAGSSYKGSYFYHPDTGSYARLAFWDDTYEYGRGIEASGSKYGGYFKTTDSSGYSLFATNEGSGYSGYVGGPSYGVYGVSPDGNKWGYIGSASYGVHGRYDVNKYGRLGGSNYGVMGYSDSDYGVYGQVAGLSDAKAVYGYAANSGAGTNYGGYFRSRGSTGTAVFATNEASGTHGEIGGSWGVAGYPAGGTAVSRGLLGGSTWGVYANAYAISGTTYGGYFSNASSAGRGVYGTTTNTGAGTGIGGYFHSATDSGIGAYGCASDTAAVTNYGGYFRACGDSGRGIFGWASDTAAVTNYGGYFVAQGDYGRGVYGYASDSASTNYGGYFRALGASGYGVYGYESNTGTGTTYGIYGRAAARYSRGVYGWASYATAGYRNYGVNGITSGPDGWGGYFSGGEGIYTSLIRVGGNNPIGNYNYVGSETGMSHGMTGASDIFFSDDAEFQDNVWVDGTLTKAGGTFLIDHPVDPENKVLRHSFVESPDMKNVYDGVIVLNDNGEAVIELPGYFEALNQDFRYQLTTIGNYADVFIKEEVKGNKFKISGGDPGMKVSWQVTGIRHDKWALENPIIVEEVKDNKRFTQGGYLHHVEFGKDEIYADSYARNLGDRLDVLKRRGLIYAHKAFMDIEVDGNNITLTGEMPFTKAGDVKVIIDKDYVKYIENPDYNICLVDPSQGEIEIVERAKDYFIAKVEFTEEIQEDNYLLVGMQMSMNTDKAYEMAKIKENWEKFANKQNEAYVQESTRAKVPVIAKAAEKILTTSVKSRELKLSGSENEKLKAKVAELELKLESVLELLDNKADRIELKTISMTQ